MIRHHRSSAAHLALGGVLALGLSVSVLSSAPQSPVGDLPAGAVPAAASGSRLAVVQLNTDELKPSYDRALAVAVSKGVKADAVTLQEVCRSWISALPKKKWASSFHPTRTDGCAAGDPKGVAVLVKASLKKKKRTTFTLPADHLRTPGMACLSFTKKKRRHDVCSTHLVAFGEFPDGTTQPAKKIRLKQAKRIAAITAKWIKRGDAVVVGGDFNAPPKQAPLTRMYATPDGKGRFTEAAQLGGKGGARGGAVTAPKQGRKIDYVFLSKNRVPSSTPGTLRLRAGSGHKMLVVKTRVR